MPRYKCQDLVRIAEATMPAPATLFATMDRYSLVSRWFVMCGLLVLSTGRASAQPASLPDLNPTPVRQVPNPSVVVPPGQCNLPPLLPTPPAEQAPPATAGTNAGRTGDEYDPGYFYLPERVPDRESDQPKACGPEGRFWVNAMLEGGWTKSAHVPALVRVGSLNGPVAFGDTGLSSPFRAGLGLTGGFWLDAEHHHGIDASFDYLSPGTSNTLLVSGASTLVLPTAGGGSYPLSTPPASAGAYQYGITTRFAAADVNFRENLWCSDAGRLDALVGYRYGHLGEESSIYGKRFGPVGEIERFRDDISATNEFHGGQIGIAGEYRMGGWYLNGFGKIAFGTVFTDTEANGKFRVNGVVMPYGYYSRPGESGARSYTRFGVMPTTGLTLGRQITNHARVFVSYNFLYMTNLVRGSDVVDTTPPVTGSNPFQVNPATPARRDSTTSDLWVQTLNLGLEWRF